MFNFCPPFCLSELKVGAVNHFNFTVLHSISLFCTDLGLIDVLLTNPNAEIVACILLTVETAVIHLSQSGRILFGIGGTVL